MAASEFKLKGVDSVEDYMSNSKRMWSKRSNMYISLGDENVIYIQKVHKFEMLR